MWARNAALSSEIAVAEAEAAAERRRRRGAAPAELLRFMRKLSARATGHHRFFSFSFSSLLSPLDPQRFSIHLPIIRHLLSSLHSLPRSAIQVRLTSLSLISTMLSERLQRALFIKFPQSSLHLNISSIKALIFSRLVSPLFRSLSYQNNTDNTSAIGAVYGSSSWSSYLNDVWQRFTSSLVRVNTNIGTKYATLPPQPR